MGNGSSDGNSRVTVAILETKMGSMEDILKKEFGAAARRDEKISSDIARQQERLGEVQVTLAVQENILKQVGTNEINIGLLQQDVSGLKAVSQRWGLAGIGTSITALAAAAYAAFKSDILGQ